MPTYHSTPDTYRTVGRPDGPLITSLYDLNLLSTSKRVKWKPDPQEKSDCSPEPWHSVRHSCYQVLIFCACI